MRLLLSLQRVRLELPAQGGGGGCPTLAVPSHWMLRYQPWGRLGGSVGRATGSISAQVRISQLVGSGPESGSVLTVRSLLEILSLPLTLPLSLKINKLKKLKKKKKERPAVVLGLVGVGDT